jgi:hypothetical protein
MGDRNSFFAHNERRQDDGSVGGVGTLNYVATSTNFGTNISAVNDTTNGSLWGSHENAPESCNACNSPIISIFYSARTRLRVFVL